jgi:hypothetical protein
MTPDGRLLGGSVADQVRLLSAPATVPVDIIQTKMAISSSLEKKPFVEWGERPTVPLGRLGTCPPARGIIPFRGTLFENVKIRLNGGFCAHGQTCSELRPSLKSGENMDHKYYLIQECKRNSIIRQGMPALSISRESRRLPPVGCTLR